jgi:hypothetical protein
MTTTLGVSRVKMRAPSTPLTQEYRPGTLQSYVAGTLDIMNSTLQRLLTGTEVHGDPPTNSKEGNSVQCIKIKTLTSPDDAVDSKFDNVDVDEILETAEEVPEVAAVAEVSSAGGSVRFGPFDAAHNNIGIAGGKFVIFQPLAAPKQIILQESGGPKVKTAVMRSPQSAAVEAASGRRVGKALVGHKEAARSLLKAKLTQGNVKLCSELAIKENGVEQKQLKLCFEPAMKEQTVVWGSAKHREKNVIWANQKHSPEPGMKQQNFVRGDTKHGSEVFKNGQNVKLTNSKNVSMKQRGTDEDGEAGGKDQDVSRGNLETATGSAAKEANIFAVDPVPQEPNCLQGICTKPARSPRQSSAPSNCQPIAPSHKPTEDANADCKQMEQLHLEIMKMKRRRNIAMKVEREVLRAKDVKLVQEVLLPARKVLLSEIGTQTSLFSLVEPGRMVEMRISTDGTGK